MIAYVVNEQMSVVILHVRVPARVPHMTLLCTQVQYVSAVQDTFGNWAATVTITSQPGFKAYANNMVDFALGAFKITTVVSIIRGAAIASDGQPAVPPRSHAEEVCMRASVNLMQLLNHIS